MPITLKRNQHFFLSFSYIKNKPETVHACAGMVLVKLSISVEAMHLRLRAVSVAEDGKCIREEPTGMEKKSTWLSRVAAACWKEVCQTVTPQYILMTPTSRRISAEESPFARPFF